MSDASLKQLVRAEWWEWLPGMLTDRGRALAVGERGVFIMGEYQDDCMWWLPGLLLPVLDDPATAGCVMYLLTKKFPAQCNLGLSTAEDILLIAEAIGG